ncbi:MAG: tRNA (adenosine(37)-N6)-threonylcarbamoyltransferase complex ATPase subunit type 1 TsaE [Candidatus Anammoxibacter sp.]
MGNDIISLRSYSETDTKKFGELLGSLLVSLQESGIVVAITGPLGAGKTCFVKGVVCGLGVKDSRVVTSPTYTIVNEYCGITPIYHIDAYRLTSVNEMYNLGCDEMFSGDGVTIIEWANNVEECLPENIINVTISYESESERAINIFSSGMANKNILERLRKTIKEGKFSLI